jgi:hypothetical protein
MMVEHPPTEEIIKENQTLWHTDRQPAGCNHCRRVYLVPENYRGASCPLCRKGTLAAQPAHMRLAQPEKMLTFRVSKQDLLTIYQQFASGVWIRPEDFNPETLLKNTRPVFWPHWLVDTDVSGHWQMEAGFNYQVESAKEVLTCGRWESRTQIENRVRWEPRVGKLVTRVDNVITPALEEHDNRQQMTGKYPLARGTDFDPALLGGAFLELPDIPPEDAWPLTRPQLDKTLAKISHEAAGAQHFRNFTIQARFSNQNWTEFFLPMYTTHYTDDDGQPQVVVVNGETGSIRGPRLASHKRGSRIAGIIAAVAGTLFLLALISLLLTLVLPPAGLIAGLLGILGFGVAILAIFTAVWPGQWNRAQTGPRITAKD